MFIQREDHFLLNACPVGYIMVHKRRMIDEDLMSRRICYLSHGGELDIIVRRTFVAPEDGVVDHTAVADIDTARATVTTTVVRYIGTDTVVSRDGSVVDDASFGEIDTARFRRGCVVIDHTGCRERRIITDSPIYRIFTRHVTYGQTAAATRCTVRDMAMAYLAVVLDTCAAAVTLYHTYTACLTRMDIAEIYLSAAVQIYTAAAKRRATFLYGTVTQLRVAYHIYTAAISRMLTDRRTARRSITLRDHAAVQRCGILQRLVVRRDTVVRRSICAVRSEPYYVVRTRGIGSVITAADFVEL